MFEYFPAFALIASIVVLVWDAILIVNRKRPTSSETAFGGFDVKVDGQEHSIMNGHQVPFEKPPLE